jgi:hypothetical protein
MVVAGTTVIVPLTVAGLADEHGHGYKSLRTPMTTMIVAITTIASTNAARCGVGITTAATTCPPGVRQEG